MDKVYIVKAWWDTPEEHILCVYNNKRSADRHIEQSALYEVDELGDVSDVFDYDNRNGIHTRTVFNKHNPDVDVVKFWYECWNVKDERS